ncbi:hypothetical protein N7513_001837 [Penicillium frequentans]|nr:hypothetical protein N7513_001837 [Penicillium glabrum]
MNDSFWGFDNPEGNQILTMVNQSPPSALSIEKRPNIDSDHKHTENHAFLQRGEKTNEQEADYSFGFDPGPLAKVTQNQNTLSMVSIGKRQNIDYEFKHIENHTFLRKGENPNEQEADNFFRIRSSPLSKSHTESKSSFYGQH